MIAFGVIFESLLNKDIEDAGDKTLHFLKSIYWPIYGELKNLERLHDHFGNNTDAQEMIVQKPYLIVGYLLLMAYMVISSVLLLNLLIAMFR